MDSNITVSMVNYCAQECEWQGSGEMSVAHMVAAWSFAFRCRKNGPITLDQILALGRIVEPVKNAKGLRTVGVRVGWDVKMGPELVRESLVSLIAAQPTSKDEADATEWFRQYEEIHPFVDGNGRTGSILWNWLRGSLHQPVHVPNLWNDPRRDVA